MKAASVSTFFSFWTILVAISAVEFKTNEDERKIYYVYRVWTNTTAQFEYLITIFKSASQYHVTFNLEVQ